MKVDDPKRKIFFVALFIVIVASLLVTMLIVLIFGVFNNKADNYYLKFKDNLIIESINQKIHIKDLLLYNIKDDFIVEVSSNNLEVIDIEGEFISLNKKGYANIEVKTKYLNKEFADNSCFVIVNNIQDEEEIRSCISFENYKNTTLKVNEKINLEIKDGLKGFVDISLSNSNIIYKKEDNSITAINEGITTLYAKLNYQTKTSLKPISICSSVDLVVESKINVFNVKVLDTNFIETIKITYDKNNIGQINGYLLIEDVKFLKYENLQFNLNYCSFGAPIIEDGKFLVPFSLNNWGIISGEVKYVGKQGEFVSVISFKSYNQDVTYFPDRVELDVNIYPNEAYVQVKPYYNENYVYAEYDVLFVCEGVETSCEDTIYISNFSKDGNTCIFEINTNKTFSIKVVLKHLPSIFALEEISLS